MLLPLGRNRGDCENLAFGTGVPERTEQQWIAPEGSRVKEDLDLTAHERPSAGTVRDSQETTLGPVLVESLTIGSNI